MFHGWVAETPKGYVAMVDGPDANYEIHPMGEAKNRAFLSRSAAEGLAIGHAAHANAGRAVFNSSWVRV